MKLPCLLLLLLSGAMATGSASANSACQFDASDRFQASEAQLRSVYATMRIALDAIPREDFHIATRQQALGEEPEVLHAWVRDNTRWVGYQGVLRGARGTLMDGYGSHADRALLLAELLESAGHQVRLARARLSEAERDQLLAAVTRRGGINRNRTQPATDDPARYQALAEQLGFEPGALRASTQQAEAAAEAVAQAVGQTAERQTAALQAMLELPGTEVARSEQFESALRDHWWVQIRTRDGWRDLDPALPTLALGQRLHGGQPQTLWADQIEPEDQHRLQIEVVAERFENRRLRERTALEHQLLPADSIGQNLVLDIHPLGLPATPALLRGDDRYRPDQLPQKLASQTEWVPLLVIGDDPVVQNSILDNGDVRDQTQRTGMGDAMREATGALGSIGIGGRSSAQQDPAELTAVFLRLSIQAPGAPTRQFERPLMDMLGAERRESRLRELTLDAEDKKRRALAMLSSTQLLAQSNWWPSQYALGHLLDGGLRNQRATLGAVHAVRRDDAALMGKAIETMTNTPVELVALAFHRQAQSAYADQIVLTELNLLSHFERLDTSAEQPARLRGFDIINNRIDLLPGASAPAREVRLSQGVLDTVLEAQLLSAGPSALNTSLEFARALEQRHDWQRVTSAGDLPDQLAADTAHHIKQALERGEWVVLPEQAEPGRLTWWRVDPRDGSTLGMGPTGRGQMVEQILALMNSIDNAASAVATVQAVWSCILTKPSPGAMQCCIVREGIKLVASDKLGTLAKQWTPILKFAGDSKIYLAALEGVIDDAAGDIVDNLMPDPC